MMSDDIRRAASALASAAYAAEKGLPEGMEILPGYPFNESLDELIFTFNAWADVMRNAGL